MPTMEFGQPGPHWNWHAGAIKYPSMGLNMEALFVAGWGLGEGTLDGADIVSDSVPGVIHNPGTLPGFQPKYNATATRQRLVIVPGNSTNPYRAHAGSSNGLGNTQFWTTPALVSKTGPWSMMSFFVHDSRFWIGHGNEDIRCRVYTLGDGQPLQYKAYHGFSNVVNTVTTVPYGDLTCYVITSSGTGDPHTVNIFMNGEHEVEDSSVARANAYPRRQFQASGGAQTYGQGGTMVAALWGQELPKEQAQLLSHDPFVLTRPDYGSRTWFLPSTAAASATLTGTASPTITETDVKDGGKTIILTLTGDTFVTGTSSEDGIAGGGDSDKTGANKWDSLIDTDLDNTNVALSAGDTVATITLPAYATYDTAETETITWTIPAASLTTSTSDVVASSTFTITAVASGGITAGTLSLMGVGV